MAAAWIWYRTVLRMRVHVMRRGASTSGSSPTECATAFSRALPPGLPTGVPMARCSDVPWKKFSLSNRSPNGIRSLSRSTISS